MSIQTALVAIKTANTTLNTLIGTRFSPDKLDQHTELPAVRFQVVSRVRLDWAFAGRPQLSAPRVQMDGYAATSALRTTLRNAIVGCFLPTTRVSGSYGGETIYDIRWDNEREFIEMLDTETEAYRITIDLIIDMREA